MRHTHIVSKNSLKPVMRSSHVNIMRSSNPEITSTSQKETYSRRLSVGNIPSVGNRKTSFQSIRSGSIDVPSPSGSFSYEEVELTEDQRRELRKAFLMFEKAGKKNKMAARDLGALLRCLGWNPSERQLEEARHELDVSARGSISFAEVERYVARHGGICNGCKEEDDIQEAFLALDKCGRGKLPVERFRYFMTTMGEKMTDAEVEELLQSMKKDSGLVGYQDLIDALQSDEDDAS